MNVVPENEAIDNTVEIPYITEFPEIILENWEPQTEIVEYEPNGADQNMQDISLEPIEIEMIANEVEMIAEKMYDGNTSKADIQVINANPESSTYDLPELFQLYCPKCKKTIERDLHEVRHHCTVCELPYQYRCKSCKMFFMGFLVANRHGRSELDTYAANECLRCDSLHNNREMLKSTYAYKHTTIRLDNFYKCGKCGLVRGKELTCVFCPYNTPQLRTMRSHMASEHEVIMNAQQLQLCILRVEKGLNPFN